MFGQGSLKILHNLPVLFIQNESERVSQSPS